MAKQLYWSIRVAGGGPSLLPPGLRCLDAPESLLVAYVSDSADPDGVLLDTSHADVLNESLVRGRRVATLVCKLVNADWNAATSEWELLVEYDESVLEDGDRDLSACDICQVECLTCDAQAKLAGAATSGESDPAWNAAYGGYLNDNPNLGGGSLPVLDPDP